MLLLYTSTIFTSCCWNALSSTDATPSSLFVGPRAATTTSGDGLDAAEAKEGDPARPPTSIGIPAAHLSARRLPPPHRVTDSTLLHREGDHATLWPHAPSASRTESEGDRTPCTCESLKVIPRSPWRGADLLEVLVATAATLGEDLGPAASLRQLLVEVLGESCQLPPCGRTLLRASNEEGVGGCHPVAPRAQREPSRVGCHPVAPRTRREPT